MLNIFADFLIAMSGDDLYQCPSQDQVTVLRDLATKLRIHSVQMTAVSKSGHPTSCRKRLQSFGWNAIVIDGHDVEEICKAFHAAETTKGMPTVIIAKTFKGRDFPAIEDKMNWHGKPLGEKQRPSSPI